MYLFLIDIIAQTLFLSSFPLYFLLLSSVPSSNRCSSGYLWTHHPSASASILLGLQACATLLVCLGTTLGGTNTSTLLMHTFTHTWTHTHMGTQPCTLIWVFSQVERLFTQRHACGKDEFLYFSKIQLSRVWSNCPYISQYLKKYENEKWSNPKFF